MKRVVCGSKWTPAQTGKQGLFRLVKQAHESYISEVAANKKSYRRYLLDFIHSKKYHDATDTWSKNEHRKNYCTVVSLLSSHEKLVRSFFDKTELDETSIAALLEDFYASDLQSPDRTVPTASIGIPSSGNYASPLLDKRTIDLIVQLANEVNLFRETLDADDVFTHYANKNLRTVTSRNNTRLVLLLDKLATHGIIPYSWQAFLSREKLILSSSGQKYLNQHDLSSTLSRAKDIQPNPTEKRFLSIIDDYIERIKNRKSD